MEKFKQEIKQQFVELKEIDSISEIEKFLKNTFRKAKNDGNNELYETALEAYNRLLYLNNEI